MSFNKIMRLVIIGSYQKTMGTVWVVSKHGMVEWFPTKCISLIMEGNKVVSYFYLIEFHLFKKQFLNICPYYLLIIKKWFSIYAQEHAFHFMLSPLFGSCLQFYLLLDVSY